MSATQYALESKYTSIRQQARGRDGRVREITTRMPKGQATAVTGDRQMNKPINLTSCPSTLFSNPATVSLPIPAYALSTLHYMTLKMVLTIAAPVTPVSVLNWFTRIWLSNSGSSSEPLFTFFPDTLLMMYAQTSEDQWKIMNKMFGFDPRVQFAQGGSLPAGTYNFYLPLASGNPLSEGNDLWVKNFPSDFTLNLTVDPTGILTAGSAASITLNNMTLLCATEAMTPSDELVHTVAAAREETVVRYVDPVQIITSGVPYNASTAYTHDLSAVTGKVPWMFHIFRPSGSRTNVGNAWWNWLDIGDAAGALLDITDSSGNPILNPGNLASSAQVLKLEPWIHQFNNTMPQIKSFYPMFFCESANSARRGDFSGGFLEMRPELKLNLAVSPGAARTNDVITIASTGGNTQGVFVLTFNGVKTSPIAFNGSAASIQTAVAALTSCAALGITVTASAALGTAGGTITVATQQTGSLGPNIIDVAFTSLANTGVADVLFAASLTTQSNGGWTNQTVDIFTYCYRAKQLLIRRDGTLSVTLL